MVHQHAAGGGGRAIGRSGFNLTGSNQEHLVYRLLHHGAADFLCFHHLAVYQLFPGYNCTGAILASGFHLGISQIQLAGLLLRGFIRDFLSGFGFPIGYPVKLDGHSRGNGICFLRAQDIVLADSKIGGGSRFYRSGYRHLPLHGFPVSLYGDLHASGNLNFHIRHQAGSRKGNYLVPFFQSYLGRLQRVCDRTPGHGYCFSLSIYLNGNIKRPFDGNLSRRLVELNGILRGNLDSQAVQHRIRIGVERGKAVHFIAV